ncbi:MAG: Crp/Fnr family transcriptional regulator [Clostridiales bacterium]|nr:MAG: Crp/Fnr family transcriptional regulator [Clostridiales bacterium]
MRDVSDSPLFKGINTADIEKILQCLSAKFKSYLKNETIFDTSYNDVKTGIVISGSVFITHDDYWGNRSITSKIGKGGIFGEAMEFSVKSRPVIVVAAENTEIVFINMKKLSSQCANACICHKTLIYNMMCLMAKKAASLSLKLEFITKRTTREKLMTYLSAESDKAGSSSFFIEFNRQELADYLSVDRSAMSAELCRMRDEGLIKFNKNNFTLL